jgi:thiol-disulfide isomerase/thioredoxin
MKKVLAFSILMSLMWHSSQAQLNTITRWRATIKTDGGELPFGLELKPLPKSKTKYSVYILNGAERFKTDEAEIKGDSLVIPIRLFDAEIVAKMGDKNLTGFYRKNKGRKSFIESPFQATYGYIFRFRTNRMAILGDVTGKWATNFINAETQKASFAVGTFQQKGTSVTGSFLTTTGDYRFMDGNRVGDSLFLSTFDGSHAFLLRAKLEGNKLTGKFYGGVKGYRIIEATLDPNAALPDLSKITYLKSGFDRLNFSFPNEAGEKIAISDKAYQGKVVVIQILGSWCPNCMDETNYLVPFYKKNKGRGLEVIGLAYEKTMEPDFFKDKMNLLRKRFGIDYQLLKAGINSSESASESLPMLNQVIGFPTTIILDKKGEIRLTHAGFSGPGTGKYYTEWVKEFETLIDTLLKE